MRKIDENDAAAILHRIRAIAEARTDVLAAVDAERLEAINEQLNRRRARLRSAGVLDPEAVIASAEVDACGRCPRVDGHPGSEAAARAVETWLASERLRTLALLGPTGRGKSFAATWTLAEQAGAWLAATEVRVSGWDDLRPRAVSAGLLVIDDLGRESTDWSGRELADVLELRHNRGLRTVVTSNLTRERIAERYGERLASRWNDERVTAIVTVLGSDLRSRGGK